jgi:hypothetical protein
MSLPSAGSLGAAVFSLSGIGITTVDITSANADGWDFAIDNVTFTPGASHVPEPRSFGLLLLALAVSGGLIYRNRHRTAKINAANR